MLLVAASPIRMLAWTLEHCDIAGYDVCRESRGTSATGTCAPTSKSVRMKNLNAATAAVTTTSPVHAARLDALDRGLKELNASEYSILSIVRLIA